MPTGRTYDVVLFGATGFTGALTAEYLARSAPAGFRWALAGRNQGKLERLRTRLAEIDPACADLDLLHADVADAGSLREVATATKVVITTVGPYTHYGEPLVSACAAAGTDYVDLCGEPEFVDRMYLAHHQRAVDSGARIVHACGFDSIPYDLGVFYTVKQLPQEGPIRIEGQVRTNATFSGGTYSSALTAFSRPMAMLQTTRERARTEPKPAGRRVGAPLGKPHRDRETGCWLVPLPTIDPRIVARSAAALEHYGPDFRYTHYLAANRLTTIAAGGAGMAAAFALVQIPPLRRALQNIRKPGEGPDEQTRAKSWFKVRFVGEAAEKRVITEVAGGDPGYGETAKMLGESAMCLALDDLPKTAGQATTATAMGDALIARLVDAGIVFRVVP
jgi:short subunit dehydrogenase-like uncharacterized protein